MRKCYLVSIICMMLTIYVIVELPITRLFDELKVDTVVSLSDTAKTGIYALHALTVTLCCMLMSVVLMKMPHFSMYAESRLMLYFVKSLHISSLVAGIIAVVLSDIAMLMLTEYYGITECFTTGFTIGGLVYCINMLKDLKAQEE